jgi:hypothetical protein
MENDVSGEMPLFESFMGQVPSCRILAGTAKSSPADIVAGGTGRDLRSVTPLASALSTHEKPMLSASDFLLPE